MAFGVRVNMEGTIDGGENEKMKWTSIPASLANEVLIISTLENYPQNKATILAKTTQLPAKPIGPK